MLRPLIGVALLAACMSAAGAMEDTCTHLMRKCLKDVAECVDGTCLCKETMHGDGLLACAEKDEHICLVRADPHIVTFSGARGNVNLPCRYRITTFDAPLRDGPKTKGCRLEIFGFNLMSQSGKYFAAGVEINLKVGNFDALAFSLEKLLFEINQAGTTSTNSPAVPWGSSLHTQKGAVTISCYYEVEQNFAIFEVKECGVRIIFRPYLETDEPGPQVRLPGIAVIAPSDAIFGPNSGHPGNLCGTPSDGDTLFVDRGLSLNINDSHGAIMFDILSQGPEIGHALLIKDMTRLLLPNSEECSLAYKTFLRCEAGAERSEAIRVCMKIMSSRKVIRCLRTDVLETFILCLEAFCQPPKSCFPLKAAFMLAMRRNPKCRPPRRLRRNVNCDWTM